MGQYSKILAFTADALRQETTMANLPKVSGQELLDAVQAGVREAFWDMIRNATDCPCADFFESVKQGVREAMLELKGDDEPRA